MPMWIDADYDEDPNWPRERMEEKYRKSGLTEFLLIQDVYFCEQDNVVLFEFECQLDEYLSDNGFCLMRKDDKTTFIIDQVVSRVIDEGYEQMEVQDRARRVAREAWQAGSQEGDRNRF